MTVKPKSKLTAELLLLRRRKGWTQHEVAAALMVSVGAIRTWEAGERVPFPDHRERIRDFIELHTLHDQNKTPKAKG